MEMTEFSNRVKAKMDELTEGLSIEALAGIDFLQLNKDAINLVKSELE